LCVSLIKIRTKKIRTEVETIRRHRELFRRLRQTKSRHAVSASPGFEHFLVRVNSFANTKPQTHSFAFDDVPIAGIYQANGYILCPRVVKLPQHCNEQEKAEPSQPFHRMSIA
jgi:hypothetical protein